MANQLQKTLDLDPNKVTTLGSNKGTKKAVRWVNFALPSAGGKTKQIISLGLHPEDPEHARIIAAHDKDPDTREARMLAALTITINDVDPDNVIADF